MTLVLVTNLPVKIPLADINYYFPSNTVRDKKDGIGKYRFRLGSMLCDIKRHIKFLINFSKLISFINYFLLSTTVV